MFKQKKYITIFLMWMMLVWLTGCNKEEEKNEIKATPKQSHPISVSASIEEYSAMDKDERKEQCENKYIEISGIVYRDDNSFKIVNESRDGIEVGCAFDNYTDEVIELASGDYVTISGLCSSSFEDSMFLYECELTNAVKPMESEELEAVINENEYVADSSLNADSDLGDDYSENAIVASDRNVTEVEDNVYSDYDVDVKDENSNNINTDNYTNNEVYVENKDSESEGNNNQQSVSNLDYLQGRYAVNDKNGKIHEVGQCIATTGSGNQLMKQPVFFDTFEDAENYSKQYHPQQEKRRCGNCWKDWY